MFSLDEAIAQWRAGLSRSEALRNEDAAELEAHLREQVAQLSDAGLTEEEAFRVAAFRMGDTGRLACEFGKVNGDLVWQRRFMWMVVGVLGYLVCTNLARLASGLASLAAIYLRQESWAIVLSCVVAPATVWVGAACFCARLASGRMPGREWLARRWQRRRACAADLALVTAILLAVKTCGRFLPALGLRYVSVDQLSPALITSAIVGITWSAGLPVILVVVFFRLRNKGAGQLREE